MQRIRRAKRKAGFPIASEDARFVSTAGVEASLNQALLDLREHYSPDGRLRRLLSDEETGEIFQTMIDALVVIRRYSRAFSRYGVPDAPF